ncbi:hypothetical protein BKA63DRAFT_92783 [Paraphoma chrysanthemicola]|nr:hypothetical protein BKA63DRAFT_92783 [Paraphoma chrysanthemicola]
MLIDSHFGRSKEVFLAQGIQPANPNGALYNEKCPYCWDAYHDDHRAYLILPCNHVFGLECVRIMVDSANGHLCPICRSALFRPPSQKLAANLIKNLLFALLSFVCWVVSRLARLEHCIRSFAPRLWASLRIITLILFENPYGMATYIVRKHTNLETHNPQLDLQRPRLSLYFLQICLFASRIYLKEHGFITLVPKRPRSMCRSIFDGAGYAAGLPTQVARQDRGFARSESNFLDLDSFSDGQACESRTDYLPLEHGTEPNRAFGTMG